MIETNRDLKEYFQIKLEKVWFVIHAKLKNKVLSKYLILFYI
jgi:hypothetical protein